MQMSVQPSVLTITYAGGTAVLPFRRCCCLSPVFHAAPRPPTSSSPPPPDGRLGVTWTISSRMLNITIALVPSRANQITPFTSATSQHARAPWLVARLLLVLQGPRAQTHVHLDIRQRAGIPLQASGAYETIRRIF